MKSYLFPLIFILLVFLLQFPFLKADPDINLSIGRDAFTDEGLNTSQLRNYINHGYLDFSECDNLVKTPLFNLILFLPFMVFGTHLDIARSTVLILILLSWFILLSLNQSFRKFTPLLLCIVCTEYYVFQYSHFSLSEMVSVTFIIWSVFFLYQFFKSGFHSTGFLFFSSFFLALAYYTKIQFLYIIPLVPLSLIVMRILSRSKNDIPVPGIKSILQSVAWMILFLLVYIVAWYLPNREIIDYVMQDEASNKFADLSSIPKTIAFNIVFVLFGRNSWMFNSLVLISFLVGCVMWIKVKDQTFRFFFSTCTLWVLIELHKLTMTYLPSRYVVSYYFAAGLLSVIVIAKMIFINKSERQVFRFQKYCGVTLLLLFLFTNSISYISLLSSRQYSILEANNYFTNTLNEDQLAMGPWTPSLTWDSKAICKPVWLNFMNDKNIFGKNPNVILSEPDEDDSNQAYSDQGINLTQHADSIHSFTIGHWIINAYWIKK